MNNEDAIYEDMEDVYFYEDFEYSDDGVDYDMNFDKVTVFSHVNAPSGQRWKQDYQGRKFQPTKKHKLL